MRASSFVITGVATAGLVVGSLAIASASQSAVHAGHLGHVGEDPGAVTQRGTTVTKLVGRVNDAAEITLSDTSLSRGRYKIVVRDSTTQHNWHLFGNGQDRATGMAATGRFVFHIRLRAGTYTVHCDRHPTMMTSSST
jgi:hypothetical protein